MAKRIQWIDHNGVRILYNDYKGLSGDEYTETIRASEKCVLESGMNQVCVINDVTDSHMNTESTKAAKEWVKRCKERGINMTIALVGISGIKRVIAQAIKRDMYFAKSLDDAKKYLSAN